MRLLFVNPRGSVSDGKWLPLGFAGVATLAIRAGHEVLLVDEEAGREFSGKDLGWCDVVCVTGMTHQAARIRRVAERSLEVGRRVIVGGVHASLTADGLPEGAERFRGPAEHAFLEALEAPGSARAGRPDPDHLMPPNRLRTGWRRYREAVDGRRAARVLGAVGCPYRCKYCCNRALTGGRFKSRSPGSVAREFKWLKREGVEVVLFAMSAFSIRRAWVEDVCGRLAKIGIPWRATTRVDLVDADLLRTMKAGGCERLGFGVESGDDEILRIIGKGTTVEQAERAFRLCREVGLDTWAMLMTHVPGETHASLRRTRRFAGRLRSEFGAEVTFQRFSPLPGSAFWDELDRWGMVDEADGTGFGPVKFTPWDFVEVGR